MICFDTDVMSSFVRQDAGPPALVRRVGVLDASEQCTTSITVAELVYGARRRGNARLEAVLDRVIADVRVYPFEERAARHYASLRVDLERAGRRLADPDLQIAAICIAHQLTLATGNTRHFERVPGLHVENWLE